MTDDRIEVTTPEALTGEETLEQSLRPSRLSEFVGQEKLKEALDNYLSVQRSTIIWVSTAGEEPIFSMADIPASAEDDLEWHNWLRQRNI